MRYFIDTEFDGYRGPLISMALVREDGRSLYFIIDGAEDDAKDPWVITNVLPITRDAPESPYVIPRGDAWAMILGFMDGDEAPHIVADWPDDLRHFCDVVVSGPGIMAPELLGFTMEVKRVDAYPTTLTEPVQHNAWWDALALRQKVLEMEAAAAGPGADERPPLAVGEVVALPSGGVPMTVTMAAEFAEVGQVGDVVRVVWMNDEGDMHETELPVAALRRAR